MEHTAFAVVVAVALLLLIALQFIGLAVGMRVMRLRDGTLIGTLKTGALLLAVNCGVSLVTGGLRSAAIDIVAGIGVLVYSSGVIKKRHDATTAQSVGVLAITIVLAVLYILPLRGLVLQAFKIPSGNMLPNVQIGDHVLAAKYAYRSQGPRRGDIAVFVFPRDESKNFIKRVVGLPGEEIEIRNKKVFINGTPMNDPWGKNVEATIIPAGSGGGSTRDNFPPTKIPADSYFLLGDNRDRSYDSRFWGFVPRGNLLGKAMLRYWHAGRIGFLE